MSAGDWIALGGLVCLALSGAFGLFRWLRTDDRATEDRQANAVRDAVATITADRDYWRGRADDFETELRRRRD